MSQVDLTPEQASEGSAVSPVDAAQLVARLRATYAAGRTRTLGWRQQQLAALGRMLVEREDELIEALREDLGRAPFEAWAADLRATAREVEDLQRHLATWMKPHRQKVPWLFRPGRADLIHEPLGVVLVIAPWNYPVQLLIAPLAAALAAGNVVVCKPSEVAPATSAAIARILPLYLDPSAVAVVEGGIPETTALLEQRWDHILYTGNGSVGRIVAAAAAKHLTPVTLELGGKSPVIVARDANVKLAASRIAFAKFLNAGQTCVAADHVWVHADLAEKFLAAMRSEISKRYGSNPRASKDFGRIINSRHAQRIKDLLDGRGYEVVAGGEVDVKGKYVAPTVLRDVSRDAAVMNEEIFGPVLPVLTFEDLDEVTDAINEGDKPLALYLFTASDHTVEQVLATTSSGGMCVNDAISHLLVPALPFGGVGDSGYGAYHGRWGFETFSHRRAVLRRPSWLVDAPMLNPPYPRWKARLTRKVF
ncbi:MAG: aldehyde dehydrogenase [Marmoricola sp.]|nr:aldehyde dehydrogenase [Marmoricola sp.]